MLTLDERIMRNNESTKRLKTEQKLKKNREEDAKRKLDMRRHIIIGKLIEEYFPTILKFQPQRTEAENKIEFALLYNILFLLAEDEEYVSRLVERAKELLQQHS